MALRPCLDCGDLSSGSRCPTHARARGRATLAGKRRRRPYTQQEQQRRAETVTRHKAMLGDWCPGWHRPPHASGDLTADHPIPVAAGGAEDAELEVLCRSCNGAKQASTDA